MTAAISSRSSNRCHRLLGGERGGRGQPVAPRRPLCPSSSVSEDRARAHGIGGDAAGTEFDGQGPDQPRRAPAFAAQYAASIGSPRVAARLRRRGDEPAGPGLGSAQQPRRTATRSKIQHTTEIDVQDGLLLLDRDFPLRNPTGDHRRAGHGGVHSTPTLLGEVDGTTQRVAVADVGHELGDRILTAGEVDSPAKQVHPAHRPRPAGTAAPGRSRLGRRRAPSTHRRPGPAPSPRRYPDPRQ